MGIGFYNASLQWDEDSFFFYLNGVYDMINTWILIIILGGNNGYNNSEIDTIEGFSSKATCVSAGQQYETSLTRGIKSHFICIERK